MECHFWIDYAFLLSFVRYFERCNFFLVLYPCKKIWSHFVLETMLCYLLNISKPHVVQSLITQHLSLIFNCCAVFGFLLDYYCVVLQNSRHKMIFQLQYCSQAIVVLPIIFSELHFVQSLIICHTTCPSLTLWLFNSQFLHNPKLYCFFFSFLWGSCCQVCQKLTLVMIFQLLNCSRTNVLPSPLYLKTLLIVRLSNYSQSNVLRSYFFLSLGCLVPHILPLSNIIHT